MFLRQGDEIVAILPDSIAYGAKGAGDTWLRYYMVRSVENIGNIQQAIDSLKIIIKDNPDNETHKGKMPEQEEKQKNTN